MKIAVAGATGRLGRHVSDVLAERGHQVAGPTFEEWLDQQQRERVVALVSGRSTRRPRTGSAR